ncbi:MAG: Trm112 family protein [Alphaproteobacteria bacterium]|nr:Trm112 family protein [Alphaproteobacteria bacterium]MBO6864561.1 Trm112 family protein [Alphaproteobacteria bacterium]
MSKDPKDDRPATAGTPGVDRQLLDFLVCPVTHGILRYDSDAQELISDTAGLAYPIRDGIPIMLPEEARELKAD